MILNVSEAGSTYDAVDTKVAKVVDDQASSSGLMAVLNKGLGNS